MIELPASPGANSLEVSFLDPGTTLRGALGGPSLRVDRPGGRFRIAVTFPLMTPEEARVFISRLVRAQSEGLRMPFPLLGRSQGSPGNPVVDGANQAGTTLNVRGARPGYGAREGYWFSIEDANGQHYLHNVAAFTQVAADGTMALLNAPALREPFADGATVHFAKPMIEGFIQGESSDWAIRVDHFVQIGFTLEEAA